MNVNTNNIIKTAEQLNCEPELIAAVIAVESNGEAFDKTGFPTLLFEPKYFNRLTDNKFVPAIDTICKATKNAKVRYTQASALDREVAIKSCSWGLFQIMGANHRKCGFKNVFEFLDSIKLGEEAQCKIFISFIINSGLSDELQDKRFDDFARLYNGPKYLDNKYDTKLEFFYKKFKTDGF